MKYIDESLEEDEDYFGSVQGYVVDKSEVNWINYLEREVNNDYLRNFLINLINNSSVNRISIILNINVEEEHRGKGFGNELMELFFEEVDSDITILVADNQEVQNKDFKLLSWYEGWGFQKITILPDESTTLMVLDNNSLLCDNDLEEEYRKQQNLTRKMKI